MAGVERLLDAAWNDELRALVGACAFTGMRISEARNFRTSWFMPADRLLVIRGKNDKERVVPMSTRAWEAIYPAFIKAMNTPDQKVINYHDRSARAAVTSMGRIAGLSRPISSHDLRATYATVMLNKGVNIRVVQELLGHSSVATTEIYTGTTMGQMREAVEF